MPMVREVYKRGARDWLKHPRAGAASKLMFGLGRVSAFLINQSPDDRDLLEKEKK